MEAKFDPMTGEPITQNEGNMDTPLKYDPMTGAPIVSEVTKNNTNAKFNLSRFKNSKSILIGTLTVLVILVAIVAVKNGAFLSKPSKVLLAINNTIKEDKLINDLNVYDLINEDNLTVSLDGKFSSNDSYLNNTSFDMTWQQNPEDKKYKFDGSVSIGGAMKIDGSAYLDKDKMLAQVPKLTDTIIMYSYTDTKKDGYLKELVGDNNLDKVDEAIIETLELMKNQKKHSKKMKSVIYSNYKALDFEKVDSEEYEIDDKDRKCSGYATTIGSNEIEDLLDDLGEVYDDLYEDYIENLADLEGESVENPFDMMKNEFDHMSDVDLTFYTYKNKLAAIIVEVEDYEVEILFMGGDSRMQNIEMTISGDGENTVITKKGSRKKNVEKSKISAFMYGENTELVNYEYNYKTGEFEIEAGDEFDYVNANGTIKSTSKSLVVELDSMGDGGGETVSGKLELKKGSSIKPLSGDIFDIGNASEMELINFGTEIEDKLESITSGSILDYFY